MPGLRVIAGRAKGRRLDSVPGDTTRPITDRAKESLFNIIGADIEGAMFLDLFSGTGSVGIEALSRGAAHCLFVDKNNRAIETTRRNLTSTGLAGSAVTLKMDALKLLAQQPDNPYDYIFIAPPQYKGLWLKALTEVDLHPGWLSGDAWVLVQIHPVEYEKPALLQLEEFDQRKYGSVLFLFFRKIP